MTVNLSSSRLHHIGVVVQDIDRSTEFFKSLGIGPFGPITDLFPKLRNIKERAIRGKPAPFPSGELITRFAPVGPAFLELLQPHQGNSIWREFLETYGEGIHHLAFVVDDVDKQEADLVRKGFSILYRLRYFDGSGDTYFDSKDSIGVHLSILEL